MRRRRPRAPARRPGSRAWRRSAVGAARGLVARTAFRARLLPDRRLAAGSGERPGVQGDGVNRFVGLWEGPTEAQLDALGAAGMPVIADQNVVGLARREDPILAGWLQQDEPDNAQSDGAGGYGPCIDPAEIIARYARMRATDPSRPVLLNLGQGVAHDFDRPYVGRGSACSRGIRKRPLPQNHIEQIVSFDIYPVTSPYEHIRGDLWRVALGIDGFPPVERRREAGVGGHRDDISADVMPTPDEVRTEAWMALIHGATGLVYFAPTSGSLVSRGGPPVLPQEIREAVAVLNRQILDLAPVLNAPTVPDAVRVASSDPDVPVDLMVKRDAEWTYVFAVAMRDAPTEATFTMVGGRPPGRTGGGPRRGPPDRGGRRRLAMRYAGYGVHLYRYPTSWWLALPWSLR